MPIYEYQCIDCKHKFDILQKIHDAAIKTCAQCGADTAVRLVSAAAFHLKGSGWYATDFKDQKKSESTANAVDKPPADANNVADKAEKITPSTPASGENT